MKVNGELLALAALPPRKEPQYLSEKRLNGPQSQSGCCGKEKRCLPTSYQELNPNHTACSIITILTELHE
jgi:hypothetical protein